MYGFFVRSEQRTNDDTPTTRVADWYPLSLGSDDIRNCADSFVSSFRRACVCAVLFCYNNYMFPKVKKPKKEIYLDHAAATPLDPQVRKAMDPFLAENFGNPSSLYNLGKKSGRAVNEARELIANIVCARPQEIIFTAGGTESTNLAIFGVARTQGKGHIITSAIEHHAVLNPVKALEKEGFTATYIPVDEFGFIKFYELEKSVRPETILVSIIYANNEIGTLQNISRVGKWVARINVNRRQSGLMPIVFHIDACQAAGALEINVNKLGVDLMSVNGSKIYGPKQTGFLFARTGIHLKPLIYGGGQEKDLRSGTENVAGIVGLARALYISQKGLDKENMRLQKLQNHLVARLLKIPGTKLNGPDLKAGKQGLVTRLPNNISLTIKNVEGEALMLYLDSYGICVSTGSACTTGTPDPSHVLMAIGRTEDESRSSIRLTLGRSTTKQQLDYVLKVLPGIVAELRQDIL